MKPVLYISDSVMKNYQSNLFHLFSDEMRQMVTITTSFKGLSKRVFPIFTNNTNFIEKKIKEMEITQYGMILDAAELNRKVFGYSNLLQANFVIVIGNLDSDVFNTIKNLKNINIYRSLVKGVSRLSQAEGYLTDYLSLGWLYSKIQSREIEADNFCVLQSYLDNAEIWKDQFKTYGVKLEFFIPNSAEYRILLENTKEYLGNTKKIIKDLDVGECNESDITISALIEQIQTLCHTELLNYNSNGGLINIVCFNPTYLFKDLVDRFVGMGCVHSDFPISEADAYIWMRPQEIWHIDFLLSGKKDREIGVSYQRAFANAGLSYEIFDEIKKRSVAIHHGTCFEPLYQFNYENLAKSLRHIFKVVGVCEFEECYGPSLSYANRSNFIFVPIGYDKNLFSSQLVKKAERQAGSPIKIGFVGRAYGTNDKKRLLDSRMAEPKGYRKGGGILLDIALRLKALSIDFEIQILGQNWEELVDCFESYQIKHHYFARDKDLTYLDYPNVYKEFDILLITARCEGGPVSAIEALSLGVDVVSTDVGVVKFLSSELDFGCNIFEYDKKWHIADVECAVKHILQIYYSTRVYEERLEIRSSVEKYDTDYWVQSIINQASLVTKYQD